METEDKFRPEEIKVKKEVKRVKGSKKVQGTKPTLIQE